MKNYKFILPLTLLIGCTTISSCSSFSYDGEKILLSKFTEIDLPNKITTSSKLEMENYAININYLDFFDLLDDKKDAVVFFGQNGCPGCEAVKPAILTYISKTNYALTYLTPLTSMFTTEETAYIRERTDEMRVSFSTDFLNGTPELYIIKSGIIVKFIHGLTPTFTNKTKLSSLLNCYVEWNGEYI